MHIALSGIQALPDADAPFRLFVADHLLKGGLSETDLLKTLDLLPPGLNALEWWVLAKYSPDQPRDDHGRWNGSSNAQAGESPSLRALREGMAQGRHPAEGAYQVADNSAAGVAAPAATPPITINNPTQAAVVQKDVEAQLSTQKAVAFVGGGWRRQFWKNRLARIFAI